MATNATIRGGDKWKGELAKLSAIKAGVKIGVLDGATYKNGTSVAYVAYINEHGMGRNPPRSFMKKTIDKNGKKWAEGIKHNIKGKIFDPAAVKNAYKMCGIVARGDMQETIMDWPDSDPRSNSISTIARKSRRGRSGKNAEAIDPFKALVDTGVMVKAISFEVT